MIRRASLTAICAGLALPAPGPAKPLPMPSEADAAGTVIGHSVEGRPIRARRVGSSKAPVAVLVVGTMHGQARGMRVAQRLRRLRAPRGVALWVIDDLNPDGTAAGSPHNANGVDVDRNFPYRWRAEAQAGAAALSEPESQALAGFVGRVRPRVTVVYTPGRGMVARGRGDSRLDHVYARRSGLPRRRTTDDAGKATAWLNERARHDTAVAVSLPERASVSRNVRAVRGLVRAVRPPRVVQRRIPFGRPASARCAPMRAVTTASTTTGCATRR